MLENTFSFMSGEVGVALKQLQKEAADELVEKLLIHGNWAER